MPALKTFRESLSLLATKRFGTFWSASLLSSMGTWTQQVAEPWLLLTMGASAFVIGLDSFAMNAPLLALTVVGGALADRRDRRSVIALFQSIQMLCPIAIVALLLANRIEAWMIIAFSLVVGVTDALSLPSFQSIVPSIVPRKQIASGLALNSIQFNLSRILGPSIAGVLMASAGAMACFVVSALSYIPFIGVALWILPRRAPAARAANPLPQRHPFAGLGVVLRQRHLLVALLAVMVTGVFCAPLVTFIPVLVKDVFHGDAGKFSVALASFGAGGILGAGSLLGIPSSVDRRLLSSGCALAYAATLVLNGLNPWFWALPPLLVLAGASMTMSNTAANSLLQATTNPTQLGLTVSLFMLALRGGMSFGALLTGATVHWLGVQTALLINGLTAIVVQAFLARAWLRADVPTVELTLGE